MIKMEGNTNYQNGWAAFFLSLDGLRYPPMPKGDPIAFEHWMQGWDDAGDFEQEMNDG